MLEATDIVEANFLGVGLELPADLAAFLAEAASAEAMAAAALRANEAVEESPKAAAAFAALLSFIS